MTIKKQLKKKPTKEQEIERHLFKRRKKQETQKLDKLYEKFKG